MSELFDLGGRLYHECEKPDCDRATPNGVLHCCAPCAHAAEHRYEIDRHSDPCDERDEQRRPPTRPSSSTVPGAARAAVFELAAADLIEVDATFGRRARVWLNGPPVELADTTVSGMGRVVYTALINAHAGGQPGVLLAELVDDEPVTRSRPAVDILATMTDVVGDALADLRARPPRDAALRPLVGWWPPKPAPRGDGDGDGGPA